MVCTLIGNDMHHRSGQNVVDSQGAAKWVHNKFWPLWWRVWLSIRVQTMLIDDFFVFYHNIKDNERSLCQDLLTIYYGKHPLGLKSGYTALCKWATCIRQTDFPFKNFCKLTQHAETIWKNVWEKSNGTYPLSIRVQTTINHISICFLPHFDLFFTTNIYINVKEIFFFRAQAEKGIAQHTSSMIWTLIDNGKLANQIMTLAAIVVKIDISWLKILQIC